MWCGVAWDDRALERRSRAARQQYQVREVEASESGRLSRWTGGPIPEEGGELGTKSGAAQSKGGGWGGSRNKEGGRDDPEKS